MILLFPERNNTARGFFPTLRGFGKVTEMTVARRGNVMPVNIETLGILQLSVNERLDLIEQIWDSLPEQLAPEEVPAWHLAELSRRHARAQAQPGAGKPWRDVLGPLEGGK